MKYVDNTGPDQPVHKRSLSGPSLFANRISGYCSICQRHRECIENVQIKLHRCSQ